MTKMFYRGYEITAAPHQVTNTEDWAVAVKIQLFNGAARSHADFSELEDLYPSMEDASNAGLAYGKHIIDKFPDKLPK